MSKCYPILLYCTMVNVTVYGLDTNGIITDQCFSLELVGNFQHILQDV